MLCIRCKKNIATVFVTGLNGNNQVTQGICLQCAKELGIAPVNNFIEKMGITDEDLENISNELTSALGEHEEDNDSNVAFPFLDNIFSGITRPQGDKSSENTREKNPKKEEKKPKRKMIESYCTDLTQRAKEGKIDGVVGREKEIARTIQILNRRMKNNPCLIGEPGVGKTAIVEGLAMMIANGKVPLKLKNKEIQLLDLSALVAGTQFRGQFESRIKSLVDEVKQAGNIILFIDEVHNIVAAGDAEGAMNAANILKPALSRADIQVIGATTLSEYRKHIEKDSALERRFQPIMVDESSVEETIEILKGIRQYYEKYHNVIISDEVVRNTVTLSERYITDRFLPDKAIDLLDEAMSDVNLRNKTINDIYQTKESLVKVQEEMDDLSASQMDSDSYARLAQLKTEQINLQNKLARIEKEQPVYLTMEDIAKVIEVWTGIPASRISSSEYARLSELPRRLKERIVGQDEAVNVITAAIKRNRAGIGVKSKPVSLIFAGPTGVGKTELVKVLANDLFDSPESLIRLDMSEFMEKHSVSRIIGSPPGYVGYDEAGQLTEKIRRKPYSVILFDEIEKAHPDVLNILLQILDDGMITDAHGRKVNFENTMIIMTTNAGSNIMSSPAGFNKPVIEASKEKVQKALSDFLRPEFLNRIDEIVIFSPLAMESFYDICSIMLSDLKKVLAEKNVELSWDEKCVEYLVKHGYDLKYGARNLRRLIQKQVEDKIADIVIAQAENWVGRISLSADESGIFVVTS